MKRLICILMAAALVLCTPAALAAPVVLTARQLDEMEAAGASDPLSVDFSALEEGLAGMADLLSEPGAREADPARTAAFDEMADRAQLLCFAAADTLEERYVENYDLQSYLHLSALSLARCFWQLVRLDKAAQNASAYKNHLELAGKLYYDCALQYAIENSRLFDGIEEDFDFLLAYFAYSGEVYVIRPYLGDEPPTEEELTLLEGIGAPINLQNAIWYRSLPVSDAAALAPDLLSGVSGMTRGAENSAYARELLSGSWGILTADDLRGSYNWLLEEGHRFDFRKVVSSGGAPDWFLRKWGDDLDENSFLAWDLSRAVQICQWACCAGYLPPSSRWMPHGRCAAALLPGRTLPTTIRWAMTPFPHRTQAATPIPLCAVRS